MYRQTVAFYLIASKNTKKINHYLWDVHKHQNWQCPLHFSHLNKLDILIKLHSLSKKNTKVWVKSTQNYVQYWFFLIDNKASYDILIHMMTLHNPCRHTQWEWNGHIIDIPLVKSSSNYLCSTGIESNNLLLWMLLNAVRSIIKLIVWLTKSDVLSFPLSPFVKWEGNLSIQLET